MAILIRGKIGHSERETLIFWNTLFLSVLPQTKENRTKALTAFVPFSFLIFTSQCESVYQVQLPLLPL